MLGLRRVFSCNFCKICKNTFYKRHLRETVSTSSVEVIGSNQGITVLIDVIIRLYNPLVTVFHNSVKDWYLFCKAHIWSLICSEHSKEKIWRYVPSSVTMTKINYYKKLKCVNHTSMFRSYAATLDWTALLFLPIVLTDNVVLTPANLTDFFHFFWYHIQDFRS